MQQEDDASPPEPTARGRRRAVGPAGARRPVPVGLLGLTPQRDPDEASDDDERLRRDVPPHHGS